MEIDRSSSKRVKLTHHSLDGTVDENPGSETAQAPVIVDEGPTTEHANGEKTTREADVGIVEYVSPGLSGFNGTLKKRYVCYQRSVQLTSSDPSY